MAGFDALGFLNLTAWSTLHQKTPLFAAGGTMVATMPITSHAVTYEPQYAAMAHNDNVLYYFDFWLQQKWLKVPAIGNPVPVAAGPATTPPAPATTLPTPVATTVPPVIPESSKAVVTIMGHEVPILALAAAALAAFVLLPGHDQGRRR